MQMYFLEREFDNKFRENEVNYAWGFILMLWSGEENYLSIAHCDPLQKVESRDSPNCSTG